ncbi:phosphatidate cytidylyltransferase [Umbelopsis sp. PMI_123]|nr:phosphatidate cytidylyltransferase [Umbelopsis sp. PMI_123]
MLSSQFLDRTTITILLVLVFSIIVMLGPMVLIAFLILVETKVVQELLNLPTFKSDSESQSRYIWISWYFYTIAAFYIVPDAILSHFSEIGLGSLLSAKIWHWYTFAIFCAYCYGFIRSVHAMNMGSCHFELQRFCWTHMVTLWTIVQTYFVIRNILTGLIWYTLPVVLVVCNDIAAFLCGRAFGRTQLCRLSPKKTLEGFIGAAIITLAVSFPLSQLLARNGYMLCPVTSLRVTTWHKPTCLPSAVLTSKEIDILPEILKSIMSTMLSVNISFTVHYNTFQIHALVFGLFASFVAPFGGLLASAIKRASQVKDFGRALGGHGGVTDRADCQLLIGIFTRLYYLAVSATWT